jgi:hypothetical protein
VAGHFGATAVRKSFWNLTWWEKNDDKPDKPRDELCLRSMDFFVGKWLDERVKMTFSWGVSSLASRWIFPFFGHFRGHCG